MKPQRGFTMIEMLVVIGVIGILAGLLLPGVSMVRNRARLATTGIKIQAVSTSLQQAASERDLVAVLVDRLTGFATPPGAASQVHPPGQRVRNTSGAWQTAALSLTDYHPEFSGELLYYAGILTPAPDYATPATDATRRAEALATYESERGAKHPWNDAFGNPLVVAYVYWNNPNSAGSVQHSRPRGISVAIGSAGSQPAGTGTWTARQADMWEQITTACDPNDSWRVDSSTNAWANPPWPGTKSGRDQSRGGTCIVSAPVEIP